MRFNVVLVTPEDFAYTHFLFDTARLLMWGLDALGHDAILSCNNLDPDRVNVLLNAHTLIKPAAIREILISRVPYVIHQTELIPRTTEAEAPTERDRARVRHYQQHYLPLLRGALQVWEWSDEHARILDAAGCRTAILQLGHHPKLDEIHHKRQKDLDLLWYGSTTPHRKELLDALTVPGRRVARVFDLAAPFRNDLIARARIVLTMLQRPGGHLPYFRIGYLVTNRVVVAGEAGPGPHFMDPYFDGVPASEIPARIRQLLAMADPALRARGEERAAAFAALPMSAFLAPRVAELEAMLSPA